MLILGKTTKIIIEYKGKQYDFLEDESGAFFIGIKNVLYSVFDARQNTIPAPSKIVELLQDTRKMWELHTPANYNKVIHI